MKAKHHAIDLQTWPRAQSFHYYTQMAPTTYTVNASLDITKLRSRLKKEGLKFFPAYLYLVTRAVCNQIEMRVGRREGVVGYWDHLTPAYPQFHEDDKTTSLLWTEYDADFVTFYDKYMEDTKRYGDNHGFLTTKGVPPENAYIVSCIPWFTFNSFSLHNHGISDYYVPSFEAGGFYKKEDKILMPLSVTVHHATTDGYHLKVLFEDLQNCMDNPDAWMLKSS